MHIVRDYFGHRIEALFYSGFEKFKTCRINKKMYKSAKLAALGITFTSRFPFPGGFSEGAGRQLVNWNFILAVLGTGPSAACVDA